MSFHLNLLLPLACAFVYVIAALTVKRAAAFGVGVWHTSFLSNWAIALLFVPGWFWWGGQRHALADYGPPALTGGPFLGRPPFTFLPLLPPPVLAHTPLVSTQLIPLP